jgi:hypothetical protein
MSAVPTGVYIDATTPWWLVGGVGTPANILASTLTINAVPDGNITLTHNISSGIEYNAPIIFQRPAADINAPSESLVMNTSLTVPTKPTDGEYITATKAAGTAYDDIAVEGLQVYGNQTTAGNTGAAAYITGSNGNLILAAKNAVYVSSLFVSSLTATNVVSTTATTGTSLTLTSFLSSLNVTTSNLSTNSISTSQIVSKDIFTSTLSVSTLNAPNFVASTLSTVVIDTKVTLTSTLSLTGNPTNINLGLGDVIQGLVGGAATQALGVGLGGAALVTGSVALVTGRTSGGVNSNIFQTVNGSTQLQFSTIGSNVSSVFLTVNSPNPLTTPGLEIQQSQGVAAGTYCVRSVGDPLYITNNVSSIQMYGQWVPVIQPTATIPAVAVSSLTVSSINGLPPGGGGGITSTVALSTATVSGNLSSIGAGTFSWGGNTISPVQAIYNVPTSFNNTLTTTSGAFLNGGATVNGPNLVVGAGTPLIVNNTARINNLSTVNISTANVNVSSVNGAVYPPATGTPTIPSSIFLSTVSVNGGQNISNGGLSVSGAATVNSGLTVNNGLNVASGGMTVTSGNVSVYNSLFVYQILQGQTIQALGSLTVGFGGIGIAGAGINMTAGNLNMTNPTSVANITNVNVNQTVNANLLRAAAISTNSISTNNINLFTINNQSYPPPAPPTQIPSTINASTIIFDGALTNIGSSPIITGTITTTNANVNFYNGNSITAGSISTTTISTNNIRVNTINGVPYVPGGGSGIPSTLNASTINVNGGQTITGGGLTISGGGTISDGGQWRYRLANTASAISFIQTAGNNDSVILDLNADKTTRFYSTLLVRDSTWPSPQPSEAAIKTYDTSDPAPYGSVITSNVSTLNINLNTINGSPYIPGGGGSPSTFNASTITANTIGTFNFSTIRGSIDIAAISSLSTNLISTNAIVATSGNITSLVISSINNSIYPPAAPLSAPTGSITIWAGGSDNGGVQTFNVPTGWLLCDGAEYDRIVYGNLFNVIGTKYGLNKPSTGINFYVPDLTFAVPMGTPYRNYTSTIFSPSRFQIYVQSWQSDFTPIGTPSAKTWKINQTVGGTLNYGTMFPATGIPLPGFPTLYVSQILSYNGYQGFIVVKSIGGAAIPDIPGGNQIIVQADGTAPQDNSGTYLYTLGSYGATSGYPQVTHNQTAAEVGPHTHTFRNTAFFGSTGLANGPDQPGKGVDPNAPTSLNQVSTISTIGVTNVATYTAPNFINMLYIIKF